MPSIDKLVFAYIYADVYYASQKTVKLEKSYSSYLSQFNRLKLQPTWAEEGRGTLYQSDYIDFRMTLQEFDDGINGCRFWAGEFGRARKN